MPVVQLIVVLAVIGFLLWLVNNKIPMVEWIKTAINIVVAIAVVIWLLEVFGVWNGISNIRIGH